ncbi:MAG: ribonuclease P protein component [Gemmatimonadetes bacterium]|nr:ribonuclease P protein component [Gemmatimonadota bacterium]
MTAEGSGTGGEGYRLPRAARITGSDEIRTLFRRGKRRKTRHLDVFVSPSPAAFPRLGVVVPKHRQKIVRRNLLKRRLREIGRTLVLPALREAAAPLDVLIRARPEAYSASFEALRDGLARMTEEICSRA